MSYNEQLEKKWRSKSSTQLEVECTDFSNVELRLELSNICNHKCLFCPNHLHSRKPCSMDKKLAFRLIYECSQLGVKKLGLFMNGEPFVTSDIHEYIEFAKDKGIEYVYITTNGSLATIDKVSKCIDAGLDSIKFSINAGNSESYKLVHGKDEYEKVVNNLVDCYEYRKKVNSSINIYSSFIVTKYSQNDIAEHKKNIEKYVDELVFFEAASFAGQMEDTIKELKPTEKWQLEGMEIHAPIITAPCLLLWNSINVTAEGYLTLCCSEAMGYNMLIDISELSINEAWNSEQMKQMRERHIAGNLQNTLCGKCIGMTSDIFPLNTDLYEKIKNK